MKAWALGKLVQTWSGNRLLMALVAPSLLMIGYPVLAYNVGDNITNPSTNATEQIVAILYKADGTPDSKVLTDQNNVIIVDPPAVGTTYQQDGITYTVTALQTNATSGLVEAMVLSDGASPPNTTTVSVVKNVSGDLGIPSDKIGDPGNPGGPVPIDVPNGNVNVVSNQKIRGSDGSDGHDGYGVEVCIPYIGCAVVGYGGTSGSSGGNGPTLTPSYTVQNHGNITSISNNLPGITVASIGGDGGDGGDAYGNFDGRSGGAAGNGGTVSVTSHVDIMTSGKKSHGIFAQSLGGKGGEGGKGYIFGDGGSGGSASQGGSVTVNNHGNITTIGAGAMGIFAQSRGGGGGSGGDSYGIVGSAGSASEGGTGGNVAVNNYGGIITKGSVSHGILAQSIGGSGGNAGDAGGIVAFGGSGSGGGNAGTVAVRNQASGSIRTEGASSYGILAQSIGGGGGNGGATGGIAAFGGTGSAGGNGTNVIVETMAGSNITTLGSASHAIVVQSIGGGGGTGAASGGLVALGGDGGAAGNGGSVTVTHGGTIITDNGGKGILAQSIGGGGGAASGTGGVVALGGKGASGGSGSTVTVTNEGVIKTKGLGADGILAQSIGGGGGAGAAAGGVVSLGGSSSSGGSASKVTVKHYGTIITAGDLARGIFAQSIGGGGGAGGTGGGLVTIGGSGSGGGAAGSVLVETFAESGIHTAGNSSHGIFAQSIGGGGGSGGTGGGVVAIGGGGHQGGSGASVTVNSQSTIVTDGVDSRGIFAQSVGGGGGSASGTGGVVALGGKGSSGGAGGTVSITNGGRIDTKQDGSDALFAQSVGGGGGSGAGSGGVVSIGGSASSGGSGGTVSVTNTGILTTAGDWSRGIFAQSVGGGGGSGGGSGGLVSIGGSGSVASNGQNVTVNNENIIQTGGDHSSAIHAQSIGGGGGDGGGSGGLVSIGGSGGGGGNAGIVTVNTKGNLLTGGSDSTAVFAQSVGGGGGNGGGSVGIGAFASVGIGGNGGAGGTGSNVYVNKDNTDSSPEATIVTSGDRSHGIQAQSIGGGGGNGGFAVAVSAGVGGSASVGVGGSGGGGGNSGNVVAKTNGDVVTLGSDSVGVFAQSVGGGGGNGGWAVAASFSDEYAFSAAVGGSGGNGGSSGTVVIGSYADISTVANNSHGIQAQSIGGGGGNGGFSVSLAGSGTFAGSLALGGSGASGGNASSVTITSQGNIGTSGDGAIGVFAQSVGGGGGNGGFSLDGAFAGGVGLGVAVGGRGSGGGDGGNITASSTGNITTSGDLAHGILSQSIGGGGGNGGLAGSVGVGLSGGAVGVSVGGKGGGGGTGSIVRVNNDGNISTSGAGSQGIFAQSVGGGGGNGGGAIGISGATQASAAVSVGGAGGSGNSADAVTVDHSGTIATGGAQSNAILAQSIGGGGGNGGFAVSGSLSINAVAGVSVGIGGKGGAGSNGSKVTVKSNLNARESILGNVNATIQTSGADANGIFAQSVGGGGGNGGFSGSLSLATGASNANISASIGGFGASGGKGGEVEVNSVDNVLTSGTGANGIMAQSVGGGGGNGGFGMAGALNLSGGAGANISAAVGGFGGAGSNSSAVSVDSTGIIETHGDAANGVFAQSVGGGGGNGGFSAAATLGTAAGSGQVSASIGGFGGVGSDGGAVTLARNGNTATEGEKASGLFAQSIGGGGGNGGLAISGAFGGTDAKNFAATLGGKGGDGGEAGNVTLSNIGHITTRGGESYGIMVQSIGGGGGTGGFAASAVLGLGGTGTNLNVGVTVGGSGGSGGKAGTASATNNGLIRTLGNEAAGIFAQSVGGGGGAGGGSLGGIVGLYGASEGKTVNANITVGGQGGSGNTGGDVTVDHAGGIVTTGDGASGIRAQSVGGGGGAGGQSNSIAMVLGAACTTPVICTPPPGAKENLKHNLQAQITVGGNGGTGNDAGNVEVTSQDLIQTAGVNAHGIFAQSVGGGGGTGGNGVIGTQGLFPNPLPAGPELFLIPVGHVDKFKDLKIAVGGSGGGAGNGGKVDVVNDGSIVATGNTSWGVFAQSVGGGGGTAGNAVAGLLGTVGIGGGAFDSLLGIDSSSGDGGEVSVVNRAGASISTMGSTSSGGIFAQSIGGGGGQGGAGSGLIDIGGAGGSAGKGGKVTVDNAAAIVTAGGFSDGILAQSVGGGGGTGGGGGLSLLAIGGKGGSSGDGDSVKVVNAGSIITGGDESNGVLAQSIGGGGGKGGGLKDPDKSIWSNATQANLLTLGGSGTSAGKGGSVEIDNFAGVTTLGEASHGLFAQSIGGGGGMGGSGLGLVSIGGSGGSSGDGGMVTVKNSSEACIHTTGEGAYGILAQSVGGGGGTSGKTIGAVAIGKDGSGGGSGSDVSVQNVAIVTTAGNNASAIFAQSVGGGGGAAIGASGVFSTDGSSGSNGNGASVTVGNTGSIATAGSNSHGIFAQSVGGGGGVINSLSGPTAALLFAGSAGGSGSGGNVAITHSGDIITTGANSFAILAQSDGGSGKGNVIIDVQGGTLIGGSTDGAAVGLYDGKDNRIVNQGVLASVSGMEGHAIRGTGGNEAVDNFGTVVGNVNLGSGSNSFNNKADAILYSGATVALGAGNLLTNEGTVSPGGSSSVLTTSLDGNLLQAASGKYIVNLDYASNTTDRVAATGTSNLAGTAILTGFNHANAIPGEFQRTIVSSDLGITNSGLVLESQKSTIADYKLLFNSNETVLSYSIDFSPSGLNKNQTEIGNHVNSIQLAGGSKGTASLIEWLFGLPSAAGVADTYDRLSPEPYLGQWTGTLFSNLQFSNEMHSCGVREGSNRFIRQEDCSWLRVTAGELEHDGTDSRMGFKRRSAGISLGSQRAIGDGSMYFGFGFAYETNETDVHDLASIKGDQGQLATILKKEIGTTSLSLDFSGGYGNFNSTRYLNLFGPFTKVESDQHVKFAGAHFRLTHAVEMSPQWYLKPMIDFGLAHAWFPGFSETGVDALNLKVRSHEETYTSINPAIEVGGEKKLDYGVLLRPYAKLGFTHFLSGTSPKAKASFQGAPDGAAPFTIRGDVDDTYADLEFGLNFMYANGTTLRAGYSGRFSEHIESHAGTLKITIPF